MAGRWLRRRGDVLSFRNARAVGVRGAGPAPTRTRRARDRSTRWLTLITPRKSGARGKS